MRAQRGSGQPASTRVALVQAGGRARHAGGEEETEHTERARRERKEHTSLSHEEAKCPVQQGRLGAFRTEERQEHQAKGEETGVGTLALFCPREVLTGWLAELFDAVAKGPRPRRASAPSPGSGVRTLAAHM